MCSGFAADGPHSGGEADLAGESLGLNHRGIQGTYHGVVRDGWQSRFPSPTMSLPAVNGHGACPRRECATGTSGQGVALGLCLGLMCGWNTTAEVLELSLFDTGGPVRVSREFPAVLSDERHFHFQIGFETAETPAPNFLADSLTVSLLGDSPSQVLALATIDTFQLSPAPENPGGIPIELTSITLKPAPNLNTPILPAAVAYDVVITVPESMVGQVRTVALDFFDNQNGIASRGLAAIPVAAIPEPGTVVLLALGGITGLYLLRSRRPVA